MKYTYIILVVIIGLTASLFIYNYESNSNQDTTTSSQKISVKALRGVDSCKNARIEIDENIFQLKNGVAEIPNVDSPSDKIVLHYGNHAVRGTMDSGSVNDMVCTYDLNDGSGDVKTYVAVLIGLTEDSYAPFGNILLGSDITVVDMQIINGKANISIKNNLSKEVSIKTIFLDGDLISFL